MKRKNIAKIVVAFLVILTVLWQTNMVNIFADIFEEQYGVVEQGEEELAEEGELPVEEEIVAEEVPV